VKILLSHLAHNSPSISAAPKIQVFPPAISYQRANLKDFTDSALLIVAFFGYQPDRTSQALEGWRRIVENCEANEPPVLAYTVLEDKAESVIHTVEVHADAEFASATHLKNEAVMFNQELDGADWDGRRGVVKLRPVAGFLGRG
jgi:hypothetical protein